MAKLRRVRTGCLTCRERHLKCDEALPNCLNCRKSGRICRRGLRISFLDIKVHNPRCLTACKAIGFLDESRLIASEYRGGLQRYSAQSPTSEEYVCPEQQDGTTSLSEEKFKDSPATIDGENPPRYEQFIPRNPVGVQDSPLSDSTRHVRTPALDTVSTPTPRGYTDKGPWNPGGDSSPGGVFLSNELPLNALIGQRESRRASLICHGPTSSQDWNSEIEVPLDDLNIPENKYTGDTKEFIATQEELKYVQAFAEGVGEWMDSLNSGYHFTQVIPWYALKSPVLLNSVMACGAKHLSFGEPELEDRATALYNTATSQLVRLLENPDRNVVDGTTASILLNVYEAMMRKPIHKMSHMVGARALIRECGWNAASTGIPAACFWLSISMEVLYCLSMNWTVTWDPDEWCLCLDWSHADDGAASDCHTWVHRSMYILAKVVNFRARSSIRLSYDPHGDQSRISSRLSEWQALKQLCDDWNNFCPRCMRPIGYLDVSNPEEPSKFPKFLLSQTSAMLGRILYHTAQCILAQVNPIELSERSPEMRELQQHHARQVMGIVASDKERTVMVVAQQAINIAFLSLIDRQEQAEAASILHTAQTTQNTTFSGAQSRGSMLNQWHLAAVDLSEPSSFPASSIPLEQSWPTAANVLDSLSGNLVDQGDVTDLLIHNPLQSAYFGHANQPYKVWHQPASGGQFDGLV